jgi:hypothetical protein
VTAGETFGARAAHLASSLELLALEASEGKGDQFAAVDMLVGDVMARALRGDRVIGSDGGRLIGISTDIQEILVGQFSVDVQHAKGSWFLPEKISLKTGLANLPWAFATYPRYASGIVWEDKTSALSVSCPDAVVFWSVFQPLFEQLFAPFELRGRLSGTKSPEDQLTIWAEVDEIVTALGLEIGTALAVMRYGAEWGSLRAPEQLMAKQRLLAALAAQAGENLGERYRAYRLVPLIRRYYAKKAKGGRAQRKSVLTKPLEKTLSGFFGGDWLSFLNYIEEQPHPDEEIATAIPVPEIFVGGTKDPAAVAADLGLSVDEVQRALATFWATTEGSPPEGISPVEERVAVLKAYWDEFDTIHANQAPGMKPLYGLVEFTRSNAMEQDWVLDDGRYSPRCYLDLLTPTLLEDIERLWGPTMLSRWPERIVTEISPHAALADAFGPALRFWHEVALTTWYLSEGPYAVTDMAGLAERHKIVIDSLDSIGCPLDSTMFTDLIEGEAQLGPQEPVNEDKKTVKLSTGVTVSMPLDTAMRRSGFEGLRDTLTRHRRNWAEHHLDTYLKTCWDAEIREAARHHAEAIAAKGKPPTPKQFARHAVTATNHWLGGDMSAFYAAIGEKSVLHPERVCLMPLDRAGFASRVFDALGGRHFIRQVVVANREEGRVQAEEQERHNRFVWLASQSLRVIQLEEAMGRTPELKEFGTPAFAWRSEVLDTEIEHAWQHYVSVVDAVRRLPVGDASPPPRPAAATETLDPPVEPAQTPAPTTPLSRSEPLTPKWPPPQVPPPPPVLPPPSPQAPPTTERGSWFRRRRG